MRQLSRDPFARVTYLRRIKNMPLAISHTFRCKWCGQEGKKFKSHCQLYNYGQETDGLASRQVWDKENFCSKTCRNSYHG